MESRDELLLDQGTDLMKSFVVLSYYNLLIHQCNSDGGVLESRSKFGRCFATKAKPKNLIMSITPNAMQNVAVAPQRLLYPALATSVLSVSSSHCPSRHFPLVLNSLCIHPLLGVRLKGRRSFSPPSVHLRCLSFTSHFGSSQCTHTHTHRFCRSSCV